MAQKKVDFVISEKGAKKTEKGLRGVDKQLLSAAKNAVGLAAAFTAIRKSAELVKIAADAQNVEKAFRSLAKQPDILLREMKSATGGIITEMSLMQKFNEAALLGLPLDRFDEMLQIARSTAQATGQSMDFMLNSIITGIGRQSKLMIDNLGIMVSVEAANARYAATLGIEAKNLDDVQRKQAFANAVLDAGAENLAKVGGNARGAFDGFNKLTSLIKDKSIEAFGSLVQPIDNVALALADIIDETDILGMTYEQRMTAMATDSDFFAFAAKRVRDAVMERAESERLLKDAEEFRNKTEDKSVTLVMERTAAEQQLNFVYGEQIKLLKTMNAPVNDLRTDLEKLTASALESGLKGLAMSQNLGEASRALANQYIVEGVFGAVKGALTSVPFPFNLLAAGAAGIAANALFNQLIPVKAAATGADFVTDGPQLMLVGEAGREQVSVTPLEGPNINGPQGGHTFIFNGNITNKQMIRDEIIPEIQNSLRLGYA